MEGSLWRSILHNIEELLGFDGFEAEPLREMYTRIQELCKIVKTILDAGIGRETEMEMEMSSNVSLNKAGRELGHASQEAIQIFKTWNPLESRVDLVGIQMIVIVCVLL